MSTTTHVLLQSNFVPPETSNIQPIKLDTELQTQYNIDDLYTGGATGGRYIAKVDDIANDKQTGQYWITGISAEGIATLVRWPPKDSDDEVAGAIDEFIGRYRTQAAYGLYIDTSVYPYRIVVDNSFMVGGKTFKYCKIFLNDDVSEESGVVISQWFENGVKVGSAFPLELVATDSLTNDSLKVVTPGWCNYKLKAGETVTALFYGDNMQAYKILPLRVFESSVVRDTSVGQDKITGISIVSPFLDPISKDTINIPLNMTMDSLDMWGVVHYESGAVNQLPIDGRKFSIFGAKLFLAVQAGMEDDLVLNYALGENEATDKAIHAEGMGISRPYRIVVTSDVKQYNVKLFGVPKWNNTYYRYEMRYFMYDLARSINIEVTEHVTNAGLNSPSFDGNNYSDIQELYIAINLEDVFPDYLPFRYTQNLNIALKGPYTSTYIPFTMDYDSNHARMYGSEGFAELHLEATVPYVFMGRGFRYEWEFLDAMYYMLKPMYDTALEDSAPKPTHYRLKTQDGQLVGTFLVSEWDKSQVIDIEPAAGDTLHIEWLIIDSERDVPLATASVRTERLGVPSKPIILVQPETDVYGALGESYTIGFKVEGEGDLTIQWYWNTVADGDGSDSLDNTDRIVKIITEADIGKRWFAEVTNEAGDKVTTTVCTVHLRE